MLLIHHFLHKVALLCQLPILLLAMAWLLTLCLPIILLLKFYYGCNEYTDAIIQSINITNMISCDVTLSVNNIHNQTLSLPCNMLYMTYNSPKVLPVMFNHRDPSKCCMVAHQDMHMKDSWKMLEINATIHWYAACLSIGAALFSILHGFVTEVLEQNPIFFQNPLYIWVTLRSQRS